MNKNKNPEYKPKPYKDFESYGYIKDGVHWFTPILGDKDRKDSVAGITMCMLSHPAFKDLKPRQRLLYVYAKAQCKGMAERTKFEEDYPQFKGHPEYIYLNSNLMVEVYKMYTKSSVRELYKDITALTEHGFLVPICYDEKSQRIIYKLIGEWQNWQPHLKYIPRFGKSKVQPKPGTKRIKQDCFDYEWRGVL